MKQYEDYVNNEYSQYDDQKLANNVHIIVNYN